MCSPANQRVQEQAHAASCRGSFPAVAAPEAAPPWEAGTACGSRHRAAMSRARPMTAPRTPTARDRERGGPGPIVRPGFGLTGAPPSWTQLDCWSNFICLSWLEA